MESVTATSFINQTGLSNERHFGDFINNITDNNASEAGLLEESKLPSITEACRLFEFVLYTIIGGSLCVLGSVGNITAFVVFWKLGSKTQKIRTTALFLFQGLALTDTFVLLFFFIVFSIRPLVLYADIYEGYEQMDAYVCVFIFPLAVIARTSTIWVTVLVGVNRYIAICMPFRALRLCTVAQAKKQLAMVLLFNVLYNIPKFFEGRIVSFVDENNITRVFPENTDLFKSNVYNVIYNNILYSIFLLILPLFILTILNIRLIIALRTRRAEMQSNQQQSDNNITLVLIIIVFVFILCQAPALINQILWNVLDDDTRRCGGVQFYFTRICYTLIIMNSAVNFIIYFVFKPRFRKTLIQNVCKRSKECRHQMILDGRD